MKKVLIIIYYWPPTGGSGVQRWVKFVKHLRNFGWEPIIFTPKNPLVNERDESLLKEIPEGIEVIKLPVFEIAKYFGSAPGSETSNSTPSFFSNIKKTIGNYIRGNFFIPDPRVLWVKPSVKFLSDYLSKNKIDAIVSSGPPHSLHKIAKHLKKKFNIPWLADFRDPWLEILDFHGFKTSASAFEKHKKLFRSVLNEASEVVVAHESVRENFQALTKTKVTLITNGYDAADIANAPQPIHDNKKFNVVFVGILYDKLNSPDLWNAFAKYASVDKIFAEKLQLIFVGKVQPDAMRNLEKNDLLKYCKFTGYVSHEVAVGYEKIADLLLLLTPSGNDFKYVIPGKLFEYLAVQKPILCLANANNDSAIIVSNSKAGIVVSPNSANEIKTVIESLFKDFEGKKETYVASNFEKFERKNLTAVLVNSLNSIYKG
jgi:glycosyltransferase involved in cell wall biosynthesis